MGKNWPNLVTLSFVPYSSQVTFCNVRFFSGEENLKIFNFPFEGKNPPETNWKQTDLKFNFIVHIFANFPGKALMVVVISSWTLLKYYFTVVQNLPLSGFKYRKNSHARWVDKLLMELSQFFFFFFHGGIKSMSKGEEEEKSPPEMFRNSQSFASDTSK
jgi:hypothetical protein